MFKWLHYVLTDESNQWDLGILLWLAYNMVYIYKGCRAPTFDFQNFGIGGAALLAGGAGLQWIRERKKDGDSSDPIR